MIISKKRVEITHTYWKEIHIEMASNRVDK